MLTIVMYHYVRDLEASSFPRIKGRTLVEFDAQLDFIAGHFSVCGVRDIILATRGESALPARACLLTFDDGFLEHFQSVYPRLLARGWSAAFFPPAHPIEKRQVLDVHKLHFILAACEDADQLVEETLLIVGSYRGSHDIPSDVELKAKLTGASRFDPPSIVFIKRLLQHGLPDDVRADIVNALFKRRVTSDERAFADDLYMSRDQLREMASAGMTIGGHGDRHVWMEHLSRSEQEIEIDTTLRFLAQIHGSESASWTMCYPYGSYNETTLSILRERKCAMAFTTRVGINEEISRPLELQRLDTNDLPVQRDDTREDTSVAR